MKDLLQINLQGKRALVCGASQGIGQAVAYALAEAGANVTLLARNKQRLEDITQRLPTLAEPHQFLIADFSNPAELKLLIEEELAGNPEYHILINNTGGPAPGALIEAEEDELLLAFQMHLVTAHMLTKSLYPSMKEAGYGRVINIISTSVKEPIPNLGVSNTIRAAMASWAKTLSVEMGELGITVNNVLPGYTATSRLESLIQSRAELTGKTPGEITKIMKEHVPAGRFAEPNETAAAVAFLCSDAASYINGINLPVDGGRLHSL